MLGAVETKAPIIVRGLSPIWGTPNPSPFVIKLLTWLRMANIEYELRPLRSPPRSRSKKIPYVELPGGEIVDDSTRIIERLSSDRGVDLDAGLDDVARATERLLQATFEGHLYFAGLYDRFATPEGWERTGRDYFQHLPFLLRPVVAAAVRRGALKNLHGQGTGRLPRSEVADLARQDLRAIAATLGDKPYFLGDAARAVDATALGFLWAMSSNPFESACRAAIESHANLVAYVDRMRAAYWNGVSFPAAR
jgi:glutathione S-transferase